MVKISSVRPAMYTVGNMSSVFVGDTVGIDVMVGGLRVRVVEDVKVDITREECRVTGSNGEAPGYCAAYFLRNVRKEPVPVWDTDVMSV